LYIALGVYLFSEYELSDILVYAFVYCRYLKLAVL